MVIVMGFSALDYAYMGDVRPDGMHRVFVWVFGDGFWPGYYQKYLFKKARAARRFLRAERKAFLARVAADAADLGDNSVKEFPAGVL